jgi:hypothetical protein
MVPFLDTLDASDHVLIAGAGGGFDIVAGLPLFHALRSAGKRVSLANLSFATLSPTAGRHLTDDCVAVTADSDGSHGYFPEKYLSQFLSTRGDLAPVFAIRQTGCRPVAAAYAALLDELKFDTLILVDGGTDSLMRGDEYRLGTPEEDAASLLAARDLPITRKFHVCVGLGVDHYHGVSNTHTLEAIAELTRAGAFRGAFSLPPDAPEIAFFRDALAFIHARMPGHESIVNSSIAAAADGHYGNHHPIRRTAGSTLHLSPLMPLFWTFLLDPVADRLLYRRAIRDTVSYHELSLAIETFRATLPALRPPGPILPS